MLWHAHLLWRKVPGAEHYHYDDSHNLDFDEHDLDFDKHFDDDSHNLNVDLDDDAYVHTGWRLLQQW